MWRCFINLLSKPANCFELTRELILLSNQRGIEKKKIFKRHLSGQNLRRETPLKIKRNLGYPAEAASAGLAILKSIT